MGAASVVSSTAGSQKFNMIVRVALAAAINGITKDMIVITSIVQGTGSARRLTSTSTTSQVEVTFSVMVPASVLVSSLTVNTTALASSIASTATAMGFPAVDVPVQNLGTVTSSLMSTQVVGTLLSWAAPSAYLAWTPFLMA